MIVGALMALAVSNPTAEALDIIGPVHEGPAIICPNVAAMNAVVRAGKSTTVPRDAALRFQQALKDQRCREEVGHYDILRSYGSEAVDRGLPGEVWFKLVVRNIYGQTNNALVGWIFD